jgi:hypothetical protein
MVGARQTLRGRRPQEVTSGRTARALRAAVASKCCQQACAPWLSTDRNRGSHGGKDAGEECDVVSVDLFDGAAGCLTGGVRVTGRPVVSGVRQQFLPQHYRDGSAAGRAWFRHGRYAWRSGRVLGGSGIPVGRGGDRPGFHSPRRSPSGGLKGNGGEANPPPGLLGPSAGSRSGRPLLLKVEAGRQGSRQVVSAPDRGIGSSRWSLGVPRV